MIKRLYIQNIALISTLEIEFSEGLTALSGETGSGKSIIIDSLAFVLGERADKSMIKYGEEKAYVEVDFDVTTSQKTKTALESLGFDVDDDLIISRTLTLDGKNECRMNGRNCSASMLKTVSGTLVDIFGQSQHLFLLKPDTHLSVLDGFSSFGDLKSVLGGLYSQYKKICKDLSLYGGNEAERERMMDILSFQIKELKDANLTQTEEDELLAKHKKAVHMEKIVSAVSSALSSLSTDEPSALSFLSSAHSSLSSVSEYDAKLSELCARVDSMKIETDDVASTLEDVLSEADYDEREIDAMEQRLDRIKMLKRKYGGDVESVLAFLKQAEEQFDNLANATEEIERLNAEKKDVWDKMFAVSKQISDVRKKTALTLSKEIETQLADLGMKKTTFEVSFDNQCDRESYEKSVSANGFDKVEFMFSANVGEPTKPLAKVISGGEMSRFMLAVKNITAKVENIPTMIFDEIDSGISGAIAKQVAIKLTKVSRDYQCVVITHLPQIVSVADHNMLIEKETENGKTLSKVRTLTTRNDKAAEVARLMGGVGEHAIPNALELMNWADDVKTK